MARTPVEVIRLEEGNSKNLPAGWYWRCGCMLAGPFESQVHASNVLARAEARDNPPPDYPPS